MNCEEARALFSSRADERLTPEERIALEGHLAACTACPGEWDRFLGTLILLRSAEEPQAPPGFVKRVIAAVAQEPWHRRLLRTLFVPLYVKLPIEAAAILVVSTLVILLFRQSPELSRPAAPPPPPAVTTPLASQSVPSPPEPAQPSRTRAAEEPYRPTTPTPPSRSAIEGEKKLASVPAQSQYHVFGVLKPRSREGLDRQLEDLTKQVSGTMIVDTKGVRVGSLVEFVVSRDNYSRLEAGLRQLGDLAVESRMSILPEQIRVGIRFQ